MAALVLDRNNSTGRVALDDVGAGHGGLSYLLKLGVDIVKIDKLFVDAIGAERYSTTIIKSIYELARSMRMEIVAEGVELPASFEALKRLGCDLAQGYLVSRPLSASDLTRWTIERTVDEGPDVHVGPVHGADHGKAAASPM